MKTTKNQRVRWYYLAHINCDCCSYDHAWLRQIHSGEFRHCIFCKRKLGDMEVTYYGQYRAASLPLAWEAHKRCKKVDKVISNFKNGVVSEPIDLDKHLR